MIDRVYGDIEVNEQVLIDLIESKALQRLKGVNQAGSSKLILDKPISRYEHCVGVMILLKKLKAGLDEQIAGLLHDVAHTAFSHVIDFAFPNDNHDFHDKFHEKIVNNSEIPNILEKHGFDRDFIMDDSNFPLLENNLPDICADRLDYTFRDMFGYVNDQQAMWRMKKIIESLRVVDKEIVVEGFDTAAQLTLDFIFLNRWVWARPLEISTYYLLGKAFRIAYDKGLLKMEDFFQEDDYVINKLKNSDDKEVMEILSVLKPGYKIKLDKNDYDFFCKTKPRYIDPKYLENGKLKRVSSNEKMKRMIDEHRRFVEAGFYIKVT